MNRNPRSSILARNDRYSFPKPEPPAVIDPDEASGPPVAPESELLDSVRDHDDKQDERKDTRHDWDVAGRNLGEGR